MRVVNRLDKSVTYCDSIMVVDVPWYFIETGVPILSSTDLICVVAFDRDTIKDSFSSFLLRNNLRPAIVY